MSTTPSLKALHEASPRNQPEFDALLERYEELGTQITSSPPDSAGGPPRPPHRRRLISLSLGFAAAPRSPSFVGGLTLGGESPQSAYAAAHKALAATSAQRSGTMTLTVNGTTLSTLRWNDHRIALRKDQSSALVLGHVLGPDLQMLLIGGGVYVQHQDGTWTHYASQADVGEKLGPEVEGLAAETHPNNALEILSVATQPHEDFRAERHDAVHRHHPQRPRRPADDPVAERRDADARQAARRRGERRQRPRREVSGHLEAEDDRRPRRPGEADQLHLPAAVLPGRAPQLSPVRAADRTHIARSPGASSTATSATISRSPGRRPPRTIPK